jgi:glyoxalase family protein
MAAHVGGVATRSGEEALAMRDPDGLALELVAHPGADPRPPWEDGPVPAGQAIRGLHSVTLTEAGHERTAALLADTLGFRLIEESAARFRFATGDGGAGALVDVACSPEAPRG